MTDQMFKSGSAKTLREGDQIVLPGGRIEQIHLISDHLKTPYSAARVGRRVELVSGETCVFAPSEPVHRRPGPPLPKRPASDIPVPRTPPRIRDIHDVIIAAESWEAS